MFFLAALLLGCFAAARASAAGDYVAELIAKSRELGLATNREWLSVVHYQPAMGGYKSLVDDPKFFAAPDGKRNPRAELEADIAAFFETPGTNDLEHAVCRFNARFHWLDEALKFDRAKLPVSDCAPFQRVYDYLKPRSVALIYPAAFMNGPASMFGHTLLVFDSADQNRLLSRAVSYAAKTRPIFGPFFAFAGIFGLYPGYFAYQAYYEKVEQYGDIGHRDVWEYDLDFTQPEIDRMMRHAWELQNIFSWYYFFDENCAYNLLYILDVGRPSLGLTDKRSWFVIPVDTVRQISRAGIVAEVKYRPSSVSKIKHIAGLLNDGERELALDLARGSRKPSDVAERVASTNDQQAILDLAAEYTQFLYTEKKLPKEVYSGRFIGLLKARSKLGKASAEQYDIPVPPRPDLGHGSVKLSPGFGFREGDPFASVRWRIAYHSLLDNDAGFTRGAQIQFLNTEARYDFESARARLQSFDLVDVFSLSPRDDFFKPESWKFRFGVEQSGFRGEEDDLLVRANTGAGRAWGVRDSGVVYAMVDADAHLGNYYAADWAVGLGPSVGAMVMVNKDWKQLIQARALYFEPKADFWRSSISWAQDYRLARDVSVSLELSRAENDGREINEGQLRLNVYF